MLYGREAEQDVIDNLLAAARAGSSGSLMVRGEAGIGKSALLDYAASRADGRSVLRTLGVQSETELPFAALHLLLRPVLDQVDRLPPGQAAALMGAIGASPSPVPDRFLVGLAALTLLSDLGGEGPILCLIDDAQWLDRASADALLFAARRLDAEGVVMLFAARDGVPSPGVDELRLGGLGEVAAGAFLTDRAGDLAPQVRRRILEEADGNPLALLEFSAALTQEERSGRLSPLPFAGGAGPLSMRVQTAFRSHIHRLPETTRVALLVAAADDTGDLDLILRAAERLGAAAADLELAESNELIHLSPAGLAFRHPLIRTAAYRGAPYFSRVAAHLALAASLPGDAHVDRRSWHRAAAATGPDDEVADQLDRTAARARDRQGAAAASVAYERAAELTTDTGRTADRLIASAELALQAGQLKRAGGLADRVAPFAAGPRTHAGLARVRGSIALEHGSPSTAGRILVEGAKHVSSSDPALAAQMLADAIRDASFGSDPALAHDADSLLSTLTLMEGSCVHTLAEGMALIAHLVEGRVVSDITPIRAAIELARTDVTLLPLAASISVISGDEASAWELATSLVTRCREHGQIGVLPQGLALLAQAQMLRGRHEEAVAAASEALRVAHDIHQSHRVGHLNGLLAWLVAVEGDEEACQDFAGKVADDVESSKAMAAWALGLCQLGLGRPLPALHHLETVWSGVRRHPVVALFAAPDLIEAAVRANRIDLAEEPAARYEDWAAVMGRPWAAAMAARLKGLLAQGEEADKYYAHAVSIDADQPFQQARTELLYGEWLRRAHRRTEARRHLRAAFEAFDRLNAAPWARRAHAELQATGEAAVSRGSGLLERLTPQERQVVRLAAAGLSNRQIGARLFLSPRTVGHHLYKAFPKLGVGSRGQLADLDLDG